MAMPSPDRSPAVSASMFGYCLAALAAALLCGSLSWSQEIAPLRLGGVLPGGVRNSATESWGAYEFTLTNLTDTDRVGRVFVRFEGRPDVQYGRELWVPARASLSSWMLVGPAIPQGERLACDIQTLLYDRVEGKDRLLRPPGDERVRSRGVLYRKRESTTAILLDEEAPPTAPPGQLPQIDSPTQEAIQLARVFRQVHKLPELVQRINPGAMPPVPEAFDGIDHVILASGRIVQDPAGMQALRRWLEQGGKVWVMLDRVEADVLAPLLGDALDFEVVDRVSLTSLTIKTHPAGPGVLDPPPQQHERPVDIVRVLLPPHEPIRHTVNGWPMWFARSVGRGQVVLTTLGPRGWYRPRTRRDPPSPYPDSPLAPVPQTPLQDVGIRLQPPPDLQAFRLDSFQPLLTQEIGYAVIRRGWVVLVFGGFLVGALVIGLVLRSSRWREGIGWLGPVAALGAAAVFLGMAEASRRAAPPTVAVAQIVEVVDGQEEATVHGLLEVYRPDSGPAEVGAERGGFFELDTSGLEGQTRRLVLTDIGAWHWENLALPAGVRAATFRSTIDVANPIAAVARFGPDGVEGKLNGPFADLSDALLATPEGRSLAVRIESDGSFRATTQDLLPKGRFLADAVLSDRQQGRQELYRALLKRPLEDPQHGRHFLLAWARSLDMHFVLDPRARTTGSALVIAPLRLVHPAVGERVTIPPPFISYQRIMGGLPTRASRESAANIDMHLRFQLPSEVLPFKLERARLVLRIDAPSRRVTLGSRAGERVEPLLQVESPLDPVRLDMTDERLLHLDEAGGLHLNLSVSDPLRGGAAPGQIKDFDEKWSIDYLELEVRGRTEG